MLLPLKDITDLLKLKPPNSEISDTWVPVYTMFLDPIKFNPWTILPPSPNC